jgi:hypothetical protein
LQDIEADQITIMREIFFTLLLLCSAAVFANPTLENEAMERPVVDCGLFTDFIADEVMTLSYTASFGDACVTIESTFFFDAAGTASEWDAEGTVVIIEGEDLCSTRGHW